MKRILVCGSKDFGTTKEERHYIFNYLSEYTAGDEMLPEGVTLISGSTPGASNAADYWAVTNWVPIEEYPADREKYGKHAENVRNFQMLKEGKPTVVIAFGGASEAEYMVRIATEAGIPVIIPDEM